MSWVKVIKDEKIRFVVLHCSLLLTWKLTLKSAVNSIFTFHYFGDIFSYNGARQLMCVFHICSYLELSRLQKQKSILFRLLYSSSIQWMMTMTSVQFLGW